MGGKNEEEAIRSALRATWLSSRPEALRRLTILEDAVKELNQGACDEDSLERAQSVAHKLCGSLGMFGFNEASSCAAKIEDLFDQDPKQNAMEITSLVGRLRILLDETPEPIETPKERNL